MTALPKFPIGYPVSIGYLGLYWADVQPTNRHGDPIDLGFTVRGLRLVPEAREDDEANISVGYPKGWEYLVARVVPANSERNEEWYEDGWFTEAQLLAKGYAPPAHAELANE